jgi:hypothetical protein
MGARGVNLSVTTLPAKAVCLQSLAPFGRSAPTNILFTSPRKRDEVENSQSSWSFSLLQKAKRPHPENRMGPLVPGRFF